MRIPSFVWVIVVIILGLGFLAFLNSRKNSSISAENQSLPVQVEVYVDYNCPHCADFEPFVKDVMTTYGEKVNVQTKMLPFLAESSTTYAYAAEAARLQNKFEEYNLELFKWINYQRDPNNTNFVYTDEEKQMYSMTVSTSALAESLELDTAKFEEDVNSDAVKESVRAQKEGIVKLIGTQSTPTVLVYGKQFSMVNFDDLKTKVGELINQIENN